MSCGRILLDQDLPSAEHTGAQQLLYMVEFKAAGVFNSWYVYIDIVCLVLALMSSLIMLRSGILSDLICSAVLLCCATRLHNA